MNYTEKYNDRLRRMQKNGSAEYNIVIAALAARDDVVLTDSGRLSTKTTATSDVLDTLIPTAKTRAAVTETTISEDIAPETANIEPAESIELTETTISEVDVDTIDTTSESTVSETYDSTVINSDNKTLTNDDIEQVAGILNRSIKVMERAGLIGNSEFYKQFAADIDTFGLSVKGRTRLSVSKVKRNDNINFINLTSNWMALTGLNEKSKKHINAIINK